MRQHEYFVRYISDVNTVGVLRTRTYVARRLHMSSVGCGDVAAICLAISTSMSCGRASGLRLAAMLRVSTMPLGAQQNDDGAAGG